ncbi:valine--tRNA ligase [Candidatus Woesearchaeota archaeon]|nr:MAG: valine--tRNA ligase [Candidatus Woesearchaeota archaeon]
MDIPKRYDIRAVEEKWRNWWHKEGIYSFNPKTKKKIFSLDTPPPTVSGTMHIGHAMAYSQADFIMRYHRMKGEEIFYPWGFDDNGLATERFVEKKAGVKAEDMPREEFRKLCLEQTKETEEYMLNQFLSLGISPDLNLSYRTIDKRVQRMSQLSFIEIYEMGREYRKEAPIIWCPECQTAIAQVELKDKQFSSVFNDIVFMVGSKQLIISTTRPELLPSCVAVFYHPQDKRYKNLKGKKAKVPLFDLEVPILEDKRVDMEKGTGIVMCCTFGDQTDVEWYLEHNLPLRISITKDGRMNQLAGKYQGMKIAEARKAIIKDLKASNMLVAQKPISHFVNVHERCGTEIEFLVSKQWFIRYLDLKDKFLELGRKLKWYPKHMRARYDNWVKGLRWDWCISRQRYFGIPIPVWYCAKCDAEILADKEQLPVDPLVDKPPVKQCPKCGCKEFVPERDVLDTWATSSLTPFIPAKWCEDEKFFNKIFPFSLRSNGHDIITFWLFNTIVKSYLHEKKLPWGHAMINGFVLDPHGDKMSKSKGNVVHPDTVLERFGADALRFWAASSKLGEDLPYQEKELVTGQKFLTKLWNASRFAIMHLSDYKPSVKPKRLDPVDKWILSKLQAIVKQSTDSFEVYEFSKTKQLVEDFFWHVFCDNYLEMIKWRLYSEEENEAKLSAKYTLYTVLLTLLKLIAPLLPHVTEEIYHAHFIKHEKQKSIHLCSWPKYSKALVDTTIEKHGDWVVDIIARVRKLKSMQGLSLKTELALLVLEKTKQQKLSDFEATIRHTTRARSIVYGKPKQLATERFGLKLEAKLA